MKGASSSLLLTVGILSTYLYIERFAARANLERQMGQDILIETLRGKFVMMQLLCVSGGVIAGLGVWMALIINPVSMYVADVGSFIFFFGVGLMLVAVVKILISILQVTILEGQG